MKNIIEYNRHRATEYALAYAHKRNKAFYDFSELGGNCTNFVSQCLLAGGMIQNYDYPFGWFYKNINNRSPSFSGVEYLYNFLTRIDFTRGPFAKVVNIQDTQLGDIIQFKQTEPKFTHSLIITKLNANDPTNPYVTTNSYDVENKPLNAYWFTQARALNIVGSRP